MTAITPAVFTGKVVHQRLRPVQHRLSYTVASLLVDVDQLEQLPRLVGYNRFNLFSIHDADVGDQDNVIALRDHAWREMHKAGAPSAVCRVLMLNYPRILGYTFNPLTVFYGLDAQDQLRMVIYEVHNTFGGRQIYPAGPFEPGEAAFATAEKTFRVSPFNKIEGHYGLRTSLPAGTLAVGVTLTTQEGPLLKAYFAGQRKALSNQTLLKVFFGLPLMTAKVVAGIHWEALKLWLKGVKLQSP
jgi:uncharacterized protein